MASHLLTGKTYSHTDILQASCGKVETYPNFASGIFYRSHEMVLPIWLGRQNLVYVSGEAALGCDCPGRVTLHARTEPDLTETVGIWWCHGKRRVRDPVIPKKPRAGPQSRSIGTVCLIK